MDIIEIAKECGACVGMFEDGAFCHVTFNNQASFEQFAQRIEQPLQYRINELAFDVAHQQRQVEELEKHVEQLREALSLLLDCAIHGYDMPEDHSYAIISRKALEQTK